ncbi:hypothetical protein D9M70_648840 [compost metagenome]
MHLQHPGELLKLFNCWSLGASLQAAYVGSATDIRKVFLGEAFLLTYQLKRQSECRVEFHFAHPAKRNDQARATTIGLQSIVVI